MQHTKHTAHTQSKAKTKINAFRKRMNKLNMAGPFPVYPIEWQVTEMPKRSTHDTQTSTLEKGGRKLAARKTRRPGHGDRIKKY